MGFSGWVEHHARSILLVALALAIAGGFAATTMPVGLFPQVSFPRVLVNLDAGSRPADQMALLVTRPVEEAVRAVPGVQTLRSSSNRGAAQISVDFGWGRDMVSSTLLVEAAVGQVLPSLPAGTAYSVKRMDPTVFTIISYALLSDTVSPVALRDLAREQIVPLLSSIPGLARVEVQGGDTAEIEVLADPRKLASFGLAMTDVATALSGANVVQSVGRLQDRGKLYLVLAERSLHRLAEIQDIVVRSDPAGIVRLRDIATIQAGVEPTYVGVQEDGKPAVLFNVYQQPDANAVQLAAGVRTALATLKLPHGVQLKKWYDQSELVTQSAASVRDAVAIGLLMAAAILIAFLRSWRVTMIAVLVVPATLAATVLILNLLGQSFNIMTLGGIAAAVGLLIDDVIVMVEHIARRAGAAARPGAVVGSAAVLPAGREFLAPLTGSSLATLIVFIPLGFLSGVTGAFAKALSITMGVALGISFLLTAFAVPILARLMINFDTWHDPAAGGEGWLGRQHGRALDGLGRRPWLLLVVLIPLLAIGWIAYGAVPTGFMPDVDEGGFVMDYYTASGTSFTETQRQVGQLDAILRSIPEVETFSRRLGEGLGGDLFESYHGDYFVRLKPNHARATPDVMADVLARVTAEVPGIETESAQLMEDLIGDLTAVPQPIEVKLYAADPALLIPQAQRAAEAVAKISGVVEVKSGVVLAGDAVEVRIDPVRAGVEGMAPDAISNAVQDGLTGAVATTLPEATKVIGVRLVLPNALTMRLPDLAALPIRAPDGHLFPLGRVATLVPVSGQAEISRDNLQPMIAVTGRIEKRGVGAAIADLRAVLARPGMLSPGVRYELGGLYAQQQIAFAGLARVFAAALVAEFILLLFLYERFWLPVVIIGCALLSTTAVFTALWITGVALNITALMGMTMIIGIGTEMSIFYVSEYTELLHQMPPLQALVAASRNRLRPITMTTLAAILTLMPLALAIGQGSGIQQPLAISIVAGLLLQFPLVLLAMPILIRLTLSRTERAVA